jgi:hypothetical protein
MTDGRKCIRDKIEARFFRIGEECLPPDEPETWWSIADNTRYSISTLGRVHSGLRICKLHDSPLGKCVAFVSDETKRSIGVHILMGLAFFGPKLPDHTVIRVNNDRDDNRLSNLRHEARAIFMQRTAERKRRTIVALGQNGNTKHFESRKEVAAWICTSTSTVDRHIQLKTKVVHEGERWKFKYLDGIVRRRHVPVHEDAIWMNVINFPAYECSDHGEIRRKTSPFVLQPTISGTNYQRVGLMQNGAAQFVTVHAIVCTAFKGPRPSPQHEVNHLNEDKFDNRAENLEWTLKNTEYSQGRACERLLTDGTWQTFPSIGAAAEVIEMNRTWLGKAISLSKPCGGYTWRFVE